MKNSDLFIEYDNESPPNGKIPNIQVAELVAEEGEESKNWLIRNIVGMTTYCQSDTQEEAKDWINIINTAKKEGDTIDNTVEPSNELSSKDVPPDDSHHELRTTIFSPDGLKNDLEF